MNSYLKKIVSLSLIGFVLLCASLTSVLAADFPRKGSQFFAVAGDCGYLGTQQIVL